MFWLLVSILVITLVLYKGLKLLNYIDHVAGIMEMIPGPTPYPFVGNVFQYGFKPADYPKKILQYCRKYEFQGFRSLVFFQYHVMLSDPAEIQKILSSSALLHKEHLYSILRPWLGDGLLTSSGPRWLKHHKIYAPAFEPHTIDGYLRVIEKVAKNFIGNLNEFKMGISAGDASGNRSTNDATEIIDVQQIVRKYTLDCVCEIATGQPSNVSMNETTDFHGALNTLCNLISERTFSIVGDTLFQFTPKYWQQRRAIKTLQQSVKKFIAAHQERQQMDREATKTFRPFLDILLNAKLDGRALNFREVFEELSTFIFTGHDPIAAALSFTLYTLSRHADVQQKVYDEQKSLCGVHKNAAELASEAPNTQELSQMTYLEAVILETLRLYPAVPIIARTNTRKAIEINGTKIAKRTTVLMCLIAMGYNEKYFDNPCEFRPTRFLNRTTFEEASKMENFLSVPFSGGPRKCVAEKYAMLQLKLLLSLLIRNFRLLPPVDGLGSGINDHSRPDCRRQSKFDPILNIRVTLQAENGILVRLQSRK